MNKPLVIYHNHCTDGFGAAFAAWMRLGEEAEYVPMNYGFKDEDIPKYAGRDVFMFDFSWPKEQMLDLFRFAKSVVWRDHHKTAFEMWCEGEIERYEQKTFSLDILLDNSKSGAMLAYEYFFSVYPTPMIIQHIDDRDRWQFKLKNTEGIHLALQSEKPWSFEQWRDLVSDDNYGSLFSKGLSLVRYQKQQVDSLAKYARPCVITVRDGEVDGQPAIAAFSGLAVNTSVHMSEVGHELANKSESFGMIWYLGEGSMAKVSLRSNGDYDVSAIAKRFGGGGHRNAAGFSVDILTLLVWLK